MADLQWRGFRPDRQQCACGGLGARWQELTFSPGRQDLYRGSQHQWRQSRVLGAKRTYDHSARRGPYFHYGRWKADPRYAAGWPACRPAYESDPQLAALGAVRSSEMSLRPLPGGDSALIQ